MKIVIIQLINYTLSFVMWMILGRIILSLILGGRQNFVTALFAKITDPAYRITQRILPFAKGGWVPFFTIVLIIIIRLAIIIIFQPGTRR
ncbi:MAG: YggT family protein [Nitrospirae bacterium]|nr:YggT family protein [Nitrospirota bacterium]